MTKTGGTRPTWSNVALHEFWRQESHVVAGQKLGGVFSGRGENYLGGRQLAPQGGAVDVHQRL